MSIYKLRIDNKQKGYKRSLLDFYFYNVLSRLQYNYYKNKMPYIVDEDWENLIILDSCRFDIFKQFNNIKGKLESRYSKGSWTVEFLLNNFKFYPEHSSLKDIIYVTANPYVNKFVKEYFFKVYSTWLDGWDEELETVPPDNVVKDALRAQNDCKDKRMIIHFMQPHYPFLGKGLNLNFSIKNIKLFSEGLRENWSDLKKNPWFLLENEEISLGFILECYINNLKIVLNSVERLISALRGTTVITSDHGNLFGEPPHFLFPFRVFGHWPKLYSENILKVPWLIVD